MMEADSDNITLSREEFTTLQKLIDRTDLQNSQSEKREKSNHSTSWPSTYRPDPPVKHVVIEFTSPVSQTQSANSDRWFFPENAVLDLPYGGLEMTCSFFVERKGSEILASLGLVGEDATLSKSKYEP